jgi:hypothetical protein
LFTLPAYHKLIGYNLICFEQLKKVKEVTPMTVCIGQDNLPQGYRIFITDTNAQIVLTKGPEQFFKAYVEGPNTDYICLAFPPKRRFFGPKYSVTINGPITAFTIEQAVKIIESGKIPSSPLRGDSETLVTLWLPPSCVVKISNAPNVVDKRFFD